ncbi:hypothetical protein MAL03_04100 [Leptospira noguchii]|uniref:Uncharacterized protein n=1 Tax=Leptospira noguchii TaxID=28182 RepID=A0AAE9GLM0_9LEPT|nr:hypothetical protein [Leptospira noguchii]UOG32161.1 hypothetical protein MAL06_04110 [Leptospira noguchii]UOG35765.1 hypothetical protein MAL02_03765 [Leptospira noguchii]UOG46700.1 hypothetical protein MAL01_03870 [Leptospira noguchii]UOG54364.1 hypothetical protein MAL09_04250 [Leptospira noguchii]UOG58255.1 hypothetical protein MAL03_04100 [Leptospira noguchii]
MDDRTGIRARNRIPRRICPSKKRR